jgi:hypothetical protein
VVPAQLLTSGNRISSLRLGLLFSAIALITSRLTLVIHEFVGHGGAVLAFDGSVFDHRLFLFGGGWIRFGREPFFDVNESVGIALGGVLLEVAVAIAALVAARWAPKRSLTRAALIAFGAIDLLHAGFYVAAGTHHGFGDGRALAAVLGDSAWMLVVPLSLAVVAGGFVLSKFFVGIVSSWLPEVSRPRAVGTILLAAAMAVCVHGGLMLIELKVASDPTYADIMKHDAERKAERELEAMRAARREGGVPMSAAEIDSAAGQLRDKHQPFPLLVVLAGALAISLAIGMWIGAGRAQEPALPSRAETMRLIYVLAFCLLLVLVLRRPWWS